MSWFDHSRTALKSMVLGAPLLLSGCLQPLYGTLGPGGLERELQAIEVAPIQARAGHYVADELIFALNGSREPVPPKYKLVVTLSERVQTPIQDTITTRATAATVITDAKFQLVPVAGGAPLGQGTAFSAASYDRFAQRISNVQGARNAEQRDARVVADLIKQQIANYFAGRAS